MISVLIDFSWCAAGPASLRTSGTSSAAGNSTTRQQQIEQFVFGQIEQRLERHHLSTGHSIAVAFEKTRDDHIVFEQAAACAPAQAADALTATRQRRQSHCSPHQQLLDLADCQRRIQMLRAHVDTIHDRVAAEEPIRIIQVIEPLISRLVARIGNEAIRLQQAGRADKFVGIPPERRARCRAACAQDALVKAIQFFALGRRLQAFFFWRRRRR